MHDPSLSEWNPVAHTQLPDTQTLFVCPPTWHTLSSRQGSKKYQNLFLKFIQVYFSVLKNLRKSKITRQKIDAKLAKTFKNNDSHENLGRKKWVRQKKQFTWDAFGILPLMVMFLTYTLTTQTHSVCIATRLARCVVSAPRLCREEWVQIIAFLGLGF